jgi:hypothetical protein
MQRLDAVVRNNSNSNNSNSRCLLVPQKLSPHGCNAHQSNTVQHQQPFTSNCSSDCGRRPASTVVLFKDLLGSSKRCVQDTASAAKPVCMQLQSTCYDPLADEATPATVRGWTHILPPLLSSTVSGPSSTLVSIGKGFLCYTVG